jgi:hypothetical protein
VVGTAAPASAHTAQEPDFGPKVTVLGRQPVQRRTEPGLRGRTGSTRAVLPEPAVHHLPTGPLSREKPFLHVDAAGACRVFLPALRHGGAGPTWTGGTTPASSVPIDRFFGDPAQGAATVPVGLVSCPAS